MAQVVKLQPKDENRIRDRIERGARLHKLRVIAEFTQVELGVALEWDAENASTYVSKIENGERDIPRERRHLAAPFLATSPYLIDEDDYIDGYLTLQHSDLRGCIGDRPRLSSVPAADGATDNLDGKGEDSGGYLRPVAALIPAA